MGIFTWQTSIDARVQDQTTELVDLYLSREIQALAITTNTSIDDTTVTVTTATEPTDGNIVCFKEWTAFYQAKIITHSANGGNRDVNLDTPLDFAFTTSWGCSERSINMNVNGSGTPVIFSLSPAGGAANEDLEWDVVRVIFSIECAGNPDGVKFGDIVWGLAKGVVLRTTDGVTKNIFNVKTNWEFADRCFDVAYDDRAGGASDYFVRIRRTFGGQSKNGVVVRLEAKTSDTIDVIVQDNLSTILDFRCIAQGHITD